MHDGDTAVATRHDDPAQIQVDLTDTRVPDPTAAYLERFRIPRPIPHPIPIPIPLPLLLGVRVLIWKQDPTVNEPGIRTAYVPGLVLNGPTDGRITTQLAGVTPVARNANADFIFTAGTPEFDCAHTYTVVRQTLTMWQRLRGGAAIPWAWNTAGNTDRLTVHPRAGVTPNAYYSRTQKALKFFYFTPTGSSTVVYTCRSLDIAAHETGHAVLDGLKPGWLGGGNPPQTGALHESFGDLSAVFLALAQLDQAEAVVALSKANLHHKGFLAALAEQFGAALGRPFGLRNADNNLKLSEVSNQVHELSQVFTGAIYDILSDIFVHERHRQRATKDPALVLVEVGRHLGKLLIAAIEAAPATGATFADVANEMLKISHAQGDPTIYRTFIRNRFTVREVVVAPTPLTAMTSGTIDMTDPDFCEGEDVLEMPAMEHPATMAAPQDRDHCCGTMTLPEWTVVDQDTLASGVAVDDEALMAEETERLAKLFT